MWQKDTVQQPEVIRPSIGPSGKMVYVHVWMTMPTLKISKFNMLKNLVILSFLSEGFANWLKRQFWNIIYNGKCFKFFSSFPKTWVSCSLLFQFYSGAAYIKVVFWGPGKARPHWCNFNVEITIGDTVRGISWENG